MLATPIGSSRLRLAASAGTSLLLVCLATATAGAGELTFDDLFAPERGGERPDQVTWIPGESALSYLWDAGDGLALHRLDATDGSTSELVAVSELGLAEGAEVDATHWSEDGRRLLVESDGDLYIWNRADDRTRRLTRTDVAEEDPKLSPTGDRVAFVRQADLYAIDLGTGEERRLTTGGVPGEILHGTTDWVYWEEIWGRAGTGFWWSPDGRRIAYYRFDDREVGEFPLIDPLPPYPRVEPQRYPKAGSVNPTVQVGVLDVATGETTWMETGTGTDGDHPYLARVDWTPDGEALAIQRLDREQDALHLLFCRPAGPEAGSCRVVIEERSPTWVNLGDDLAFLPDGRFVWGSERSGWRHLYLYSTAGELLTRLTAGDWSVTSLDHVDAGGDVAIATGHGQGPLGAAERQVYRVPLSGGGARRLTTASGWHGAEVSPDGRFWLHTWNDADHPGWERVERLGAEGDQAVVAELPSEPPAFDPQSLPRWRFFEIDGPGGAKLPARMLVPPGVDPESPDEATPVPAIMYHYGGPGSQVVTDSWGSRGRGLWHKMMAQRGYAVLSVDNRASTFFGKPGEDRVHRRFGPENLAAQKAGAAYLSSLPWVDGSRIGLWGWSGGGTHTLYSLTASPGTWRAGVAGAPVTDWRYYDSIWTERYLDHPEDNQEGYDASSPVTYATDLEDRLLIVHGQADDNVHPQSTHAYVDRLIEAGIPFEMALYPGQKHGFRGAAARHFYQRMTEFFERTLRK